MPAPNDPKKYAEWMSKLKSRTFTEEWRKKISEVKKGKNKGQNNPFYGKHHTDDSIRRNREAHTGKYPSEETRLILSKIRKGKSRSLETRQKISEGNKGKIFSEEHRRKLRESHLGLQANEKHPQYGKPKSDETRQKISKANKGKLTGEKHPLWKGGISFEPYCPKFNKPFKEKDRSWFNFRCVNCGASEVEIKHSVHHVYYNKQACCEKNENGENVFLIDGEQIVVIGSPNKYVILCPNCHSKTNWNRIKWARKFESSINNQYNGRSWIEN